jgi:hypothetical protein
MPNGIGQFPTKAFDSGKVSMILGVERRGQN